MTKSRGNTFMLLAAFLLAAAAAVGVYAFTNSSNEDAPETAQEAPVIAPTPTQVPLTDVLVTTRDVPANTSVTADMVETKQIPIADKHSRALTAPVEAVGKLTTVALAQGEQVLTSRLMDDPTLSQRSTFAYKVPEGKRAISLTFNEVIGAGSMVQPGDHVDVIGTFLVETTDLSQAQVVGEQPNDDQSGEGAAPTAAPTPPKFDQWVSTYVVEDVEVLWVAQATSPDQLGIDGVGAAPTPTPTVEPEATTTATSEVTGEAQPGDPVGRPKAISVTLAVTPDQAQRLLLASNTVFRKDDSLKMGLRLVLRAPGDTTIADLPPAEIGPYSIGNFLDGVAQPIVPQDVVITAATFERRALSTGEELEFKVTVKNISSDVTIKSANNAPPEFTYTQGTAYDDLGFYAEPGTYRLGLNIAGAYPTQYPYRWSLGRDLKPGESTDVVGYIKMTDVTPATRYWFGVILEPNTVTQDGVAATDITVLPPAAAVVTEPVAVLRDAPRLDGAEVADLAQDDYLTVLEIDGDWYRVEADDRTRGWIEASAVKVVPPRQADTATPVAATPVIEASPGPSPVAATPAST